MPANFLYAVLKNADSVPVSRGMVVRISANSSFVRAQADSAGHLAGLFGIVGSGVVNATGPSTVVISHAANEPVLLETGLTLAVGDVLYVSASVAGRATNVPPANAATIGTITDTSLYASVSMVKASIGLSINL